MGSPNNSSHRLRPAAIALFHGLLQVLLVQTIAGDAVGSSAAESPIAGYDLSLRGSCRSEILYHCAHVLSDEQRLQGLKARAEGAAAAVAVASAAVEHVVSRLKGKDAVENHSQASTAQPPAAKSGSKKSISRKDLAVSPKAGVQSAGTDNMAAVAEEDAVAAQKAADTKQTADIKEAADTKQTAGINEAADTKKDHAQAAAGKVAVTGDAGKVDDAKEDAEDWLMDAAAVLADEGGVDEGVTLVDPAFTVTAAGGAAAQPNGTSGSSSLVNGAQQAAGTAGASASAATNSTAKSTDSTGTSASLPTKQQTAGRSRSSAIGAGVSGDAAVDAGQADAQEAQADEEADAAQLEQDEVEAATHAALHGTATAAGTTSNTDAAGARRGKLAVLTKGNVLTHAAKAAMDAAATKDTDANSGAAAERAGDTAKATQGDKGAEEVVDTDDAQAQGGAVVAVSDAEAIKQRMQTTRRRKLLANAQQLTSSSASDPRQSLAQVLQALGMDANASVRSMQEQNAPIARCLRQAMHEQRMSISPDVPDVGPACQDEVRTFFVNQATDIRLDPPLVAACASDIAELCKAQLGSPEQLFVCLKSHKAKLRTGCQAMLMQRQIEGAEDIALDPVLNAACAADRKRLCVDAGWGDGSAQECLEYHLHGSSLGSLWTQGEEEEEDTGAAAHGKARRADQLGLSPPCAAALFQRQVEESEDIRLNYRLSTACAGDKASVCKEVRPGHGDVVGCLERHQYTPDFSFDCKVALDYNAQMRASDVRLDAQFRATCQGDVEALCFAEEAKILTSMTAPVGEGVKVLECMRRGLSRIHDARCKQHVTELMAAAYADSRLDGPLLAHCEADIDKRCMDQAGALPCLQAAMSKHESLEPECGEAVRERQRQAAADIRFIPPLQEACAAELHALCTAPHLQGPAVIDCLADSRHKPEFGVPCRTALVAYLAGAVSDVRMLHTLKEDCSDDIDKLCKATLPGEGRVLSCLQQRRADIEGQKCKQQILRLLGLAVEDYRLDYTASQACKADVQRYCGGVKAETGSFAGGVHACLRKSWEHLTPACKDAEQALEQLEHEDVRLNPRIQRECPLAISQFCEAVPPGNANVLACLQQASSKPDFPGPCRAVMASLLERSQTKYSLNTKLKAACAPDVATMCPDALDEPQKPADRSVLGCLSSNSSGLGASCRAELAALVRVHLNRYRIGMPLTSPCDGDVMAKCNVEKQVTPFLMGGFIQSCLSKHASTLHKPCWALMSMFDESQYQASTTLEAKHWTPELQQEALATLTSKITAEIRQTLEPKLLSNLHHKVDTALESHNQRLRPMMSALLNASALLMAGVVVLALVGWFLWHRMSSKPGDKARTVAIKDGRV